MNLRSETPISAARLDEPIVLCAADENYIRPLAVSLYSAVTQLAAGHRLRVLLMDGGISEASWGKLERTLSGLPISIQVIQPNRAEVADLSTSHHITHTAYFRLLAARLVPETLDRVIYLDSDVLLKDDLSEIWKLELGTNYCLAAVDVACPWMDAAQAPRRFRRAIPYLATLNPVPNWRLLGLRPNQSYFNSGVMVLNLQRWREESIEHQLLGCLREHAQHVWCWDQYALNVVFAGQWRALPGRWNQGAHLFDYPDESHSPLEPDEYRQMRDHPALIHFTSEFKPWLYGSEHPLRDEWFKALDQTDWAGWRPDRPPFRISDWWTRQAVHWSKRWIVNYRKLKYTMWSRTESRLAQTDESMRVST